ncbi:MAG: polysaccharide export protein [Pseudomonadota bacterium]|nr:polysaccharide export protein [Pseudomonadota bacterium]
MRPRVSSRVRMVRREPTFTAARCALVALAFGLMAGCSDDPRTGDSALDQTAVRAHGGDEYVIGSGDSLSVFVYHAPELSEPDVPVRPDGRISVPLIQDMQASGKTPTELAHALDRRLAQYVRDPNVTVIVRSFVGPLDRQIKVIGEATDPEAIPYRDHLTVLDVMIATKGLTKFAAGNRAIIVRHTVPGRQRLIHVRLGDLIKDGDISQNVAMQPGDTLIIPQSWF